MSARHIANKLRMVLDTKGTTHPFPVEQRQLAGYGAFGLHYSVEWPLSIVLDRHTVGNIEMLFRHLFYAFTIQARLAATWKLKINVAHAVCACHARGRATYPCRIAFTPPPPPPNDITQGVSYANKAFAFRYRALTFVKNLLGYWTQEVIELNSARFDRELDAVCASCHRMLPTRPIHRSHGELLQCHWPPPSLQAGFRTVEELRKRLGQHVTNLLTECMVDDPDLLRVC
jgi:hypothetical protein